MNERKKNGRANARNVKGVKEKVEAGFGAVSGKDRKAGENLTQVDRPVGAVIEHTVDKAS
jgi:hypothetical protein